MIKYVVEFSGTIEVEADCEVEAECNAALQCSPDNCRVVSSDEDCEEDSDGRD